MTAIALLRHPAVILALLSTVFLAETQWFGRRHSITFDETIYLNLAHQSLHDGRLVHAFTTLGVAPLPVMLAYTAPLRHVAREPRPSPETPRPQDRQLIRGPRFVHALMIGVSLVAVVFAWLYSRHGLVAATVGGAMLSLSPTIVAHASVATTDLSGALFVMLGLAATAWWATRPGIGRFLILAVSIAAAMSAKYSGAFLLCVAAAVFFLTMLRQRRHEHGTSAGLATLRAVALSVLLGGLVFPLWWGLHGFAGATDDGSMPGFSWSSATNISYLTNYVQSTAPMAGLSHQITHSREGDEAFLMGERSTSGWWYFFPALYLFKSTPAELTLTLFMASLIAAAGIRPWRALMDLEPALQTLLIAATMLMGMLVTTHLNLGHRYMIAMYPIMILAACDRLAVRFGSSRRLFPVIAGLLLAAQLWSNLSIAPHFLAYVNAASGGPENGWRLLADSSIDWGQDLPGLKDFIDEHVKGPVAIKYFGTAQIDAYGIDADDTEHLRLPPDAYDIIALSATYLDGLHLGGRDPFKEFRDVTPVASIGYSILIFDLQQPDALRALRESLKIMH